MISIAHGADALSWFWFPSFETGQEPDIVYCYGLMDKADPIQKRIQNLYGQDKWAYACSLNAKIEAFKPFLDDITWQAGYSVHSEGADHYFISDIMSVPRLPMAPYEFVPENADQTKYWERGFIKTKNVHAILKIRLKDLCQENIHYFITPTNKIRL